MTFRFLFGGNNSIQIQQSSSSPRATKVNYEMFMVSTYAFEWWLLNRTFKNSVTYLLSQYSRRVHLPQCEYIAELLITLAMYEFVNASASLSTVLRFVFLRHRLVLRDIHYVCTYLFFILNFNKWIIIRLDLVRTNYKIQQYTYMYITM